MSATKLNFEADLVKKFAYSNDSKIYKYINSILKCNSLPVCMYLESQVASSDLEKASLFNQFFNSVYSKSDFRNSDSQSKATSSSSPSLNFIEITKQEVFSALSSLNPSKASGMDSIGPKILKTCSLGLHEVLHHLFSLSLITCSIPPEWKIHCIVPVFKSGDKCSVSNYRPISLLSSVSKVLERLVYDKLFSFLSNRISKAQFGFLKSHSCVQQLLCFLCNISSALDARSQVDVIYLDFKKAFDKVSHGGLLFKLNSLGIGDKLLKWLQEYLSHRQQLVSINGVKSSLLPVTSGVPQGSILGPLLFLVFINDLPDSALSSIVQLFADDTKCSKQVICWDDVSNLQEDLDRLYNWSVKWSLLFNDSKCVSMSFSSSKPSINSSYHIAGNSIEQKNFHRDLGIIIIARELEMGSSL